MNLKVLTGNAERKKRNYEKKMVCHPIDILHETTLFFDTVSHNQPSST